MNEVDDRLLGDPVWELFANPVEERSSGFDRYQGWLIVAAVSVGLWFVSPLLAEFVFAISFAVPEFCRAQSLARSIPEKAGRFVCVLLTMAWGFGKFGAASFFLLYVTAPSVLKVRAKPSEFPLEFLVLLLFCFGGLFLASILTAVGLWITHRSGMRIWLGEGFNQARALLLGMLLMGLTLSVLTPFVLLLAGPSASHLLSAPTTLGMILIAMVVCMIGGARVVLVTLDKVSQRILADSPGKFGPKVPSVGKWNS